MYPRSLDYLVNCSIIFTELPLLERPAAAKAAGFDAIELWWPFDRAVPSDQEVDDLIEAILGAGVTLHCLNLMAGNMGAGERGIVSAPGRQSEFADNVAVCAQIAARLGTFGFNALYGTRIPGVAPDVQDEVATENLTYAAKTMDAIGGHILIEALSGDQPYPIRTTADALAVVNRVRAASGYNNISFLADLFHLSVNGDDVSAGITSAFASIAHVQIADAPGRHEPGTGTVDLAGYLNQLAEMGYAGAVGLEYVPEHSSETSFEWLPRDQRGSARFSTH